MAHLFAFESPERDSKPIISRGGRGAPPEPNSYGDEDDDNIVADADAVDANVVLMLLHKNKNSPPEKYFTPYASLVLKQEAPMLQEWSLASTSLCY